MENKYFDKFIRERLKGLEAEYQPNDWNLMDEKLDAEVFAESSKVDDIYLDGFVYENLAEFETPYEPADWDQMSNHLDQEFSLQQKLYRYKIAEFALLLLAIFTFIQFAPLKKQETNTIAHAPYVSSSPILNEVDVTDQIAENIPEANLLQTTKSEIPTLPINKTKTSLNKKENKVLKTIQNTSSSISSVVKSNIDNPSISNHGKQDLISKTQKVENEINNKEEISESKTISGTGYNVNHLNAPVATLEELAPALLTYEYDAKVSPCTSCAKSKKLKGLRVGMFAGIDQSLIMTPYDNTFGEKSYDQFSTGYSGGVSIGWVFNKWEIEVGALYASVKYDPKYNIEYKGSFEKGYSGVGLKSAELSLIQFPLNIHYKFKQFNKWHFYALGGGTYNYAYQAIYDEVEYVRNNTNNSNRSNTKKNYGITDDTPVYNKEFISANLGLGLERFFSSRWSLFLQPTYKHQVFSKGLGPNKDRINSFSILAGVKASL